VDEDCLAPEDRCAGEAFCDLSGALPRCGIRPGTAVVCDAPDDPCFEAACDPATGSCGDVPVMDGTPCEDGSFCNGVERCEGDLGCRPGIAPPVDDEDACTTDACDDDLGMVIHTPVGAPDAPASVSGPSEVQTGAEGLQYTAAASAGATGYFWTVPVGWTFTGGGGTATITVTAGDEGTGKVCASAQGPCGQSAETCLDVTVTAAPSGDKRVFVTSIKYNGDLGGLDGADAKCQDRANAAGLGGRWKAWLSDSVTDARNRLSHSTGPYVRIDGQRIADSWTDLVTRWVDVSLEIDEFGSKIPYEPAGSTMGCSWAGGLFFFPWTATLNDGTVLNPSSTCGDWKTTSGTGTSGLGGYSLSQWTEWCQGWPCSSTHPLYCFEQ
jgi:hypothetical protein